MKRETLLGPSLAAAIARRAAAGLKLTFAVPGRPDPFVCYARNAVEKACWLSNAAARGWEVVDA